MSYKYFVSFAKVLAAEYNKYDNCVLLSTKHINSYDDIIEMEQRIETYIVSTPVKILWFKELFDE